jgi:hypothetical protein
MEGWKSWILLEGLEFGGGFGIWWKIWTLFQYVS